VLRNAAMLIPFDETQQVLSQDLEYHADMRTVRTDVPEMIEKLYDMPPSGMIAFGRDEFLKQLDLV
jgi:hypothetical protein